MPAAAKLEPVLHAIADPRRRGLLERIVRRPGITVRELTDGSGVTQGAVSQHLKVLREAGLVAAETRGRNAHYRAQPEALAPVAGWLNHYERFWRESLGDLRLLLEEMER